MKTVSLSGDGPHTKALNARAEPILRAEALKAGSADIDVVSGATSTQHDLDRLAARGDQEGAPRWLSAA